MKKLLILLFISSFFFSCDSFLEEESQDQIIPKTPSQLKEFLFGECYLKSNKVKDFYLDIMTDDVSEHIKYANKDNRLDYYGYYTWQQSPEHGLAEELTLDKAYGYYYHQILISNIVLDMLETMKGDANEIADLKGETYFIRAYAYFMLVNLYGEPYNKTNADNLLGVPINDNIGVKNETHKRASVADVYKRIISDITNSIKFLKEGGVRKTQFRIGECAANILAARASLFSEDYDAALTYSNRAIELNPTLCNLNTFDKSYLINLSNPEVVFTYGSASSAYYQKYTTSFSVSPELTSLYEAEDLRKSKYFTSSSGKLFPMKTKSYTDSYEFALRISEAYLIRAEVYANKEKYDLAMDDINKIRENRFSSVTKLSASDKKTALDYVKRERRLELCFEQFRWFDLRRWGMPEIKHTWTTDIEAKKSVTYTLKEGDKAYTLPIPKDVLDNNKIIKRIGRPVRNFDNN